MDAAGTKSARDALRAGLACTALFFAFFHALVWVLVWFNPPSDVVLHPTLSDGRVMAEFDSAALLQGGSVEFDSPRMWARIFCGLFMTLPPALLLAAVWSRYIHFVLTRGTPHGELFLLTFPLVLLSGTIVGILPNAVSRSIGWRDKHGRDPSTGAFGWIIWAPMLLSITCLGFGGAHLLLYRLIVAGVAASCLACYAAACVIERWKRNGLLIQAETPIPRFSLRSLMLAVLGITAYASGLVLIFR